MPYGVGGVSDDGRSSFLSVVAEDGEDAPLPRVDGHLQVRVRIEKHALLQASGTQICNRALVRLVKKGGLNTRGSKRLMLLFLRTRLKV